NDCVRQLCPPQAGHGAGERPLPPGLLRGNAAAPLFSRTPLGSRPHLQLPAPPPRCTHPAPRPKTTLQRLPSGPGEAQRARIRSGSGPRLHPRQQNRRFLAHRQPSYRRTGSCSRGPGESRRARPRQARPARRPRLRPRPGSARGAPSRPGSRALFGHSGGRRREERLGRRRGTGGGLRALAERSLSPPLPPPPRLGTHEAAASCPRNNGTGPAKVPGAVLLLGALQVLALLGTALSAEDPLGTSDTKDIVSLQNSTANSTDKTQPVPSNNTSEPSGSAVNSSTSAALTSSNMTATTVKPTSKMAPTPGVSNVTSTTLKSTSKTSVSHNTAQMSTSSMTTTTHSSTVTSVSSSATITATIHSEESKRSKFDTGSFVGGIVLTLGVLSILYIGCKMYYSRRGIRYRTIDEHDAII
uniref:Transmembrane protein 123 n=1 Tax=Oryctolagus cuniculus TaxID=9986 RepID=G1SQG4_RABIT